MTKFFIIAFATLIMMGCSSAEPEPVEPAWVPFACHHHSVQADEACAKEMGRGRSAWCETTTSPQQKVDFDKQGCSRPFLRQTSSPFSTVYCC